MAMVCIYRKRRFSSYQRFGTGNEPSNGGSESRSGGDRDRGRERDRIGHRYGGRGPEAEQEGYGSEGPSLLLSESRSNLGMV